MEIHMNRLIPSLVMLALSAASLTTTAKVTEADIFGSAAQPPAAQRTIVIDDKTKSVTVEHDEVIRFLANGQEFAWAFNGMAGTLDMSRIAPAGAVDRALTVYVWPSARDLSENG
jgi:heavy-metal resistance protein CzcE